MNRNNLNDVILTAIIDFGKTNNCKLIVCFIDEYDSNVVDYLQRFGFDTIIGQDDKQLIVKYLY
jgi:hypothetical protein